MENKEKGSFKEKIANGLAQGKAWTKEHELGLAMTGLTIIGAAAFYAAGRIQGWTDGYDKGTADTIVDANSMFPDLIDTVARESYFATRDVLDANDPNRRMKEIVEAAGGEKMLGSNVSIRFYESPFMEDYTTTLKTIVKNRK